MAFFKKREWPEPNAYDIGRKERLDAVYNAMHDLENAVGAAIVRKSVIDLYPDGLKKSAAKDTFQEAQRYLEYVAETYDKARDNYTNYVNLHIKAFLTTADWHTTFTRSSSDIIEKTYARYFKIRLDR